MPEAARACHIDRPSWHGASRGGKPGIAHQLGEQSGWRRWPGRPILSCVAGEIAINVTQPCMLERCHPNDAKSKLSMAFARNENIPDRLNQGIRIYGNGIYY